MNAQASLFDSVVSPPLARASDPATSHIAARRVERTTGGLESQVVELLAAYSDGLTKDEICDRLYVAPRRWPTVAALLSRMKHAGRLRWSGVERAGQNVWQLRGGIENVETGDRL